MRPFGERLNFYVELYAGVKGAVPPKMRKASDQKTTLYVCTIEKAHSLVNSLIEKNRLVNEIGLVVADEVHMIGDESRGTTYEMTLTKVLHCSTAMVPTRSNKSNSGESQQLLPIQIVATTATLRNKTEMADFLNAHLYERDFRPVELRDYLKVDKQISELNKAKLKNMVEDDYSFIEPRRCLDTTGYSCTMNEADPDGLVKLVRESLTDYGDLESCLIFCKDKKNCENVAKLV